jgi:hypothetical protein
MSDFFEPPPPPPKPPRERRQPEWFGPPDNVLPVVLPLDVTLARTPDLALSVRSVDVYPTGALFHAPLLVRELVGDPMEFMPFHPRRRGSDDNVLRLGVQYADGSKATNLGMPFFGQSELERPPGPVLMPRGGGGGGHRWDVSFWLWPLPTEDPFELVVEWPSRGIELSRFAIPVAQFVAASTRCEQLWPNGGGDVGSGGATQITVFDGP